MTAGEILKFFENNGLHISDGVDPCSGEDYEAICDAAKRLAEEINSERVDRAR